MLLFFPNVSFFSNVTFFFQMCLFFQMLLFFSENVTFFLKKSNILYPKKYPILKQKKSMILRPKFRFRFSGFWVPGQIQRLRWTPIPRFEVDIGMADADVGGFKRWTEQERSKILFTC